jgi:hypothetical protein
VYYTKGFILKWIWHCPRKKYGPIGIKTPKELGSTKTRKGGKKPQIVVVQLLEQMPKRDPPYVYHVYLDNLFVSEKFLELLRSLGYVATGTCRTISGVFSELIDLKSKDKGKNEMPWGTLYAFPTESNQINQVG